MVDILKMYRKRFRPIIPADWQKKKWFWLDLSRYNHTLQTHSFQDTAVFDQYILDQMFDNQLGIAVGGYNEERMIYQRSTHFSGQEPRCIHIGLDIWTKAGTPVQAPLEGEVHSFQDNAGFGDYGPTIILKHVLNDVPFYTLYGHLSRFSLTGLTVGMPVKAGAQIGEIGPFPENGDWPPHLHFQIMTDMLGFWGDFPGVVTLQQRDYFLQLCPDPNLILQF